MHYFLLQSVHFKGKKTVNCRGCDREDLLSNSKYYKGNVLEGLRKPMKTFSQKTGDPSNARKR
jgi:hypothetical protein